MDQLTAESSCAENNNYNNIIIIVLKMIIPCFRYGDCHPVFYIGDLESAIKDSLLCRAKDVRALILFCDFNLLMLNCHCCFCLLAEKITCHLSAPWRQHPSQCLLLSNLMYGIHCVLPQCQLHHMGMGPNVPVKPCQVPFFPSHLFLPLSYTCDVLFRLLTMCTRHFGSIASNTVQNLCPDELPLLLIISRNRGANEVMQAIHGVFHL
jgi:hypothetical protein